ncbi:MAG: peptidoglycan recognition protein family protein [Candidatus Loosdrechtia sp.]|uniref:peptidoglycan recognition protein family protein n=1 Tax=Candidatus Loosdrechtia sp. TaxID=3101272 RepID=UPI003A6094B6|nr:MAG: peptidoglycan recognition family protein [Candidatus Jettenia sp. AMX2]
MYKYEKVIQYISLVIITITLGIFIFFPFFDKPKTDRIPYFINPPLVDKLDPELKLASLCRTDVDENQWKYIVIHHSATARGNAAVFDDYHRNKRGWEYGLAYHFVIGNGTLSGNGEIEVAERWKKQIHGAHTANMDYNRVAIGICLVGDFENGGGPTENQFESLVKLTQYLSKRYSIPLSNIILHKQVHQKGTACPGKNFPFAELKARLMQIALNPTNQI